MKIRELIDKITDKRRYGHLMILFFSDLDKDIKDVIREYQSWNPEYVDHLRRIMKEFGIKEEDAMDTKSNKLEQNTVEFMGSGKVVVELMKKTLCDFKNIYIEEAVLTSPNKSIDEGTAVLSLLINIPDESKWISIYYTHIDEGTGSGSITYKEHSYLEKSFPQHSIDRSRGAKFPWGNHVFTEEQILDEILERKKCK